MKDQTERNYPRTLIIGLPFNDKTGGGITMSNLFRNWPKNNLALASAANVRTTADFSVCSMYYQLGYKGKLHPFPLNIFLPKIKCGPIDRIEPSKIVQQNQFNGGKYRKLYRIIYSILSLTGTYNLFYKLDLDEQFKRWIVEYKPDIIYSQLGSLELVRFVNTVQTFLNIPLAIHIMDDWPGMKKKPSLFKKFWERKFNMEFQNLINRSSVLMSIGEEMSDEYYRRYNRKFIPFHNPIDVSHWLASSKTDYSIKREVIVLYAGRIGLGMKESIIDLATVVKDLTSIRHSVCLEIMSPDISELDGKIEFGDRIKWIKPIEYTELPKKFSKADILVIPIDFSERSISFLKFSHQTKLSEYMISGTPILVYGPGEVSTVKYAKRNNCAYVVTDRDRSALSNAIIELISNAELRERLGTNARMLSAAKEDSLTVREEFRKCLIANLE